MFTALPIITKASQLYGAITSDEGPLLYNNSAHIKYNIHIYTSISCYFFSIKHDHRHQTNYILDHNVLKEHKSHSPITGR